MELTYHWKGDYLIPDVSLDDGSSYNIGKYGRMRQNQPDIYRVNVIEVMNAVFLMFCSFFVLHKSASADVV